MRVGILELVGRPGRTRALVEDVAHDAFGDASWGPLEGAFEGPVHLDLHLDAVVEGILVRGSVSARLGLTCARCLEPAELARDVEVTELFSDPARREPDDEPADPGYELLDDATAIDLSTLVRDALLVDLPVRVLCRPDCPGICPVCGSTGAVGCGHAEEAAADPRWAALADLRLPAEPGLPPEPAGP